MNVIGQAITLGGGGSGGAELVIVGGTTSPAKANHNTIWIYTDVEITSNVLSATEPESHVNGMVWVIIGDSGDIKVASPVGGDWITVYPISAKQYISGAWVDKTAKSYQNGEWVDWIRYLWKEGEGALSPFTTPVAHKYPSHDTNMVIGDTLSISNDYIGAYRWDVPIENFPSVNTIFAEVSNVKYHTADSGDWKLKMSVSDRQDHGSVDKVNTKCYTVIPDSVAKQIVKLDIPEGMTGYFAIGGWGTITIHNVWAQ